MREFTTVTMVTPSGNCFAYDDLVMVNGRPMKVYYPLLRSVVLREMRPGELRWFRLKFWFLGLFGVKP